MRRTVAFVRIDRLIELVGGRENIATVSHCIT
ncbi:PTS transporter subunit EIIB, partial [Citrobacter amalonaticus]